MAIKGIIWKKSSESETAEILFHQIIANYDLIGIGGHTIESKSTTKFTAENGDVWEVLSGYESFRGKKCNISYIERGMPKEVVYSVILPCTVGYPYRAITYFGDYGLEGDDYNE